MGEHAERNDKDERATQAIPPVHSSPTAADSGNATDSTYREPRPRRRTDWGKVKDQVVGLLAGIVRWVGLIFALILVMHVIFVIGEANPDNGIVSFVENWSDALSLGFQDLFTPEDPKLKVLINFGIAALFWMVVSSILARIIRRVGGTSL
ncbi:hypothetical protein [Qaidamihabitans albus]|uniref:hypothetical protein n=1 Tax=Qaidamihabitans albus TaxID=2795733 RepID=UPI0018F10E90|nr:hypothetical protein [Qaidamihabitans albus]